MARGDADTFRDRKTCRSSGAFLKRPQLALHRAWPRLNTSDEWEYRDVTRAAVWDRMSLQAIFNPGNLLRDRGFATLQVRAVNAAIRNALTP
jgi:hypothetical protein